MQCLLKNYVALGFYPAADLQSALRSYVHVISRSPSSRPCRLVWLWRRHTSMVRRCPPKLRGRLQIIANRPWLAKAAQEPVSNPYSFY